MSRPKARPTARLRANRPTSMPSTWGGSAWPVRAQVGVALVAVSGVVVVPGLAEPFLLPKATVAAVGVALVLSTRRASGLTRALSVVVAAGLAALLAAALLAEAPVSALVGRYPRYEGFWVLPVYAGALAAGARMRTWQTARRALEQVLAVAAMVVALGAMAQLAGAGSVERIGSVLGNASELGTWAAVAAVFLMPSALQRDGIAMVGAAASTLAVVLSGSRGGLLGLLAGLIVMAALMWRQQDTRPAARMAFAAVAAVPVLAVLIPGTRQRIFGVDPVAWATVSGRGWLWRDTMDLIAAHPILGVGPSGFVDAIGEFHSLGWAREVGPVNPPDSPHNLILQLLTAGGLALLLVCIAGVVLWLRQARNTLRTNPQLTTAAGPAIVAGVVAMQVHFTSAATMPLLALLGGWVAAVPLPEPPQSRQIVGDVAFRWLPTITLGWCALVLAAATAAEASIAAALAETARGDETAAQTSWATAHRLRRWDQDLWLRQGHAATFATLQGNVPPTTCLNPTELATTRLPNSSEATQDRAQCLEANGDPIAATQVLATGRVTDPTNIDLLLLSGVIAARSDDLQAAEELLLQASRLAPEAAAPWVNLALVYDQMGRSSDAEAARNRASKYTP